MKKKNWFSLHDFKENTIDNIVIHLLHSILIAAKINVKKVKLKTEVSFYHFYFTRFVSTTANFCSFTSIGISPPHKHLRRGTSSRILLHHLMSTYCLCTHFCNYLFLLQNYWSIDIHTFHSFFLCKI